MCVSIILNHKREQVLSPSVHQVSTQQPWMNKQQTLACFYVT